MSLHHSGAKEILSFYELERRNAFDSGIAGCSLEAMEREIQQLTAGSSQRNQKCTIITSKGLKCLEE